MKSAKSNLISNDFRLTKVVLINLLRKYGFDKFLKKNGLKWAPLGAMSPPGPWGPGAMGPLGPWGPGAMGPPGPWGPGAMGPPGPWGQNLV